MLLSLRQTYTNIIAHLSRMQAEARALEAKVAKRGGRRMRAVVVRLAGEGEMVELLRR